MKPKKKQIQGKISSDYLATWTMVNLKQPYSPFAEVAVPCPRFTPTKFLKHISASTHYSYEFCIY